MCVALYVYFYDNYHLTMREALTISNPLRCPLHVFCISSSKNVFVCSSLQTFSKHSFCILDCLQDQSISEFSSGTTIATGLSCNKRLSYC